MLLETVTFPAAFAAGILSFLSPCVLPLIPAYFLFITGLSPDELSSPGKGVRQKVFLSTLAYVCGFSLVFILLGASASVLGDMVSHYTWVLRYAGGLIIIVFGLHLLDIIRIRAFHFEKRLHIRQKPVHLSGVFIIGMAFAAGWTPCIGPMLGAILIVAGNSESVLEGIGLLSVFSLGLAIPFMALSLVIHKLFFIMQRAKKVMFLINRISGFLLIIIGLLLIFDRLNLLAIL